jgi:hypothetical protein
MAKETTTTPAAQPVTATSPAAAPVEAPKIEMIPKERLDDALDKQRTAEQRAQLLEQQIQIMQANMPKPTPAPAAAPAKDDFLESIAAETVVDGKQLVAGLSRVEARLNEALERFGKKVETILETQEVKGKSGFNEIIQQHLPDVLSEDPTLGTTLAQLQQTNPAAAGRMAYALASAAKKTKEAKAALETAQNRVVPASSPVTPPAEPGSLASVGGGAPKKGYEAKISGMTDAEFQTYKEGVKSGRITFT